MQIHLIFKTFLMIIRLNFFLFMCNIKNISIIEMQHVILKIRNPGDLNAKRRGIVAEHELISSFSVHLTQ